MCSLCSAATEIIVHLFLMCTFTSCTWDKYTALLGRTLTVSEAGDIWNKVDTSRNIRLLMETFFFIENHHS